MFKLTTAFCFLEDKVVLLLMFITKFKSGRTFTVSAWLVSTALPVIQLSNNVQALLCSGLNRNLASWRDVMS